MSADPLPPDVDYLTRDYESFRQLLLSLIERARTPWTETAAADLGITVVEILANRLDHLSYAADRIAEEGFLTTARRREYARRHAALGDHPLDFGNASSGYQYFRVSADTKGPLRLRAGAQVGTRLVLGQTPDDRAIAETTEDAIIDARLNKLSLSRSARAGASTLHLLGAGGEPLDLTALGLRRETRLCIRDQATGDGEILRVRGVSSGVVELLEPLTRAYVATDGDRGAEVLGNIVPIRRGVTIAVPDAATLDKVDASMKRQAGAETDLAKADLGVGAAADAEAKARASVEKAKQAAAAAAKAQADAEKKNDPSDAGRAALAQAQANATKASVEAEIAADAVVAAQAASAWATTGKEAAARALSTATAVARKARLQALPAGGAALADVLPDVFLELRLADIRRLRADVEAARELWVGDASYAGWWELANVEVARALHALRSEPRGAITAAQAASFDERLVRAGSLYAALARAVGLDADDPGDRVPQPGQRIALPGDTPVLWSNGEPALRVYVAPPPPVVSGSGQGPASAVSSGSTADDVLWERKDDLLQSRPDDRHYVVEVDEDGDATLRFGDGVTGAMLPPGSTIRAELTTGDLRAGDFGPGALVTVVSATVEDLAGKPVWPSRVVFDGAAPTENQMATSGARGPEDLREALGRTIRRELATRVIPVTPHDYETLLADRVRFRDVAEASAATIRRAWPSADRVDVVIRPRSGPGVNPTQVLEQVRGALRVARLAGTDVWVRMCDPLYVSLSVVVELHPTVDAAEVRPRIRGALHALFTEGDKLLGVARTRAEVYKTIEAVPGVVWSRVAAFDVADRDGAHAQPSDEIKPGPDEVVRCLDLPGVPGAGRIEVSVARRFRLVLELGFDDPDPVYAGITAFLLDEGVSPVAPDPVPTLASYLTSKLSGVRSPASEERWPEVSAARLDAWFSRMVPKGATYRLRTLFIYAGERLVDPVALRPGEVPVVDSVQIREQGFRPHFSLERTDAAPVGDLEDRVRGLLSGVAGSPVMQGWGEITMAQVRALLLARSIPSTEVSTLSALRVGERRVERLPLGRHDVPVFDGFVGAPKPKQEGST